MNAMLRAYLECALWSSSDDAGEPLDDRYDISDIAAESIESARTECEDFAEANADALASVASSDDQTGHDFWLTRNGHGAGFWDRGYPYDLGQALTRNAEAYGSSDASVGDDGLVYFT